MRAGEGGRYGARMDQVRAPQTTAEYSLSAGEMLTRWHLDATDDEDAIQDSGWQQAAYLVAAAVHAVAVDTGLHGGQITEASLDQVLAVARQRPASAIEAFPHNPFAAIGEQLLGAFGTEAFDQAQRRAVDVLRRHLDDAGDATATLGGRSAALTRMFRRTDARCIAQALGAED